MRDDEVKPQLAKHSKNELIVFAMQLNAKHSGLRKEQLIDSILSSATLDQIKRILSLSWWQKYHNHVYGGVSIFSLILAAVFYYFPRNPTDSKQVAISNREIVNSNINLNQNGLMANTNSQNSETKQANNDKALSNISSPSTSIRSPQTKSIPQPPADQQRLVFVYLNSARSLYNKGEYQAAIAQCNKALSLDPNNSEAQNLKKSIQATVRILSPGHTK